MGVKFNKTIKGALFLTILFLCIVICKVRASGYYDDYFEGYSIQASEQELYNETNTFDFVGINVNNSYYNTNQRNSNIVNNETSLTIITHGLGGSASNWSNEVHDGNCSFAKDNSSIFNRLELLTKENQNIKTDIFLATMFSKNTFKLFDLNDPMNREGNCYNPKRASSRLNNISNHIIVVFESSDSTASNDYLYQELNFMISKVIYDIKVLNGGYLPKINLIGHSRGGITNLQYALDHPDLVDGLFSIGTPYFGSDTAATDLGKGMCSNEEGIVYDGYYDVIDRDLYLNYYDRWNNGFDRLYHNINAYAIGGYSNTDFIFDRLIEDDELVGRYICDSGLKALKYLVSYCKGITLSLDRIGTLGDKLLNFAREEGYELNNIEAALQIAEDIQYYDTNSNYYENIKAICPILGSAFFMNDLLVDLNSQLGKDNHASGNKQNNYGFKTFSKCFTKDNCDVSKIAMNDMPAVVHNLEPRDDEIIHFILSKINISSNQTSYLYNELDDNTIEIVSYRGNTNISELIIPSEIDGKRVVKIGDYAFANLFNGSSNLTINIPDTIIEIGFFAFANNSSLYKVVFSNSSAIKTINSYSFVNCIKLNRLLYGSASRLPLSLIAIGEKAFYNCNFSSIYINDNLCELGSGAFACNKNLKTIRKTSGNKYFAIDNQYGLYSSDYKTFYMLPMNSSIKDYFINENTLYIDNYACINNKSLDVIHINKNIITIGESAFEALGASNNNQKKKIVYLNCSHVPEAREYSFARNDIDIYVAYDLKDEYICKWKENADFIKEQKIQISFYANDELKNQLEVNNFSSFIVPSFTEVIDGYMFDGWESDDIEIPWYVGEYYLASYDNKDIKFSTKLTPNVYECEVESINSIEYLSIEKIDEIGNKNYVTYGSTDYKLPVPKIQRRDYRFCGWEDNGIVYTDSEGNGIAIWDKTEKCILKALLEPIVYNINYELNGGTCNNLIKTYTCESGVIELPTPFKTSYDFLYWTYMGKEIKKFNVTQYLCDMEITAKWSDYKRIACSTSRTVYDYECIDVSNANSNSSIVLTISPSAYNVIIVGNTNRSYTSFRINISNRYNTNNLYITIENLEIKASIGYDTISYYGTISFDLYLTYKGKCRITGGAGANSRVAGGTGDTGCMAINMHYSNLNFKAEDSNSYLYVIGGSGGNGGRGNDGLRGEDGSAASGIFLGNGKDGKDGGNGTNGGTGGTGGYAISSQYIYVYASCNGKIAIFGGDGGNGGAGGNGGRGGDGGAGGGSLVISRNGGDGGNGGNGGNGGDGGAGNTSIYSASYFYNKDYVWFSSGDQGNGGTGGNGGNGGNGGANGPSKFSLGSHGSGGSGGRYGIGGKGYYNGGYGLGGYFGSYYYIDKKL